jgi:hypothetical protein
VFILCNTTLGGQSDFAWNEFASQRRILTRSRSRLKPPPYPQTLSFFHTVVLLIIQLQVVTSGEWYDAWGMFAQVTALLLLNHSFVGSEGYCAENASSFEEAECRQRRI